MEAVKLLSEVLDNYQTAMAFHWESCGIFRWLSLPGFADIHKYQFFDESLTAQKLRRYIIERYGILLKDKGPESTGLEEIVPESKDRMDESQEGRWKLIQVSWEKYLLWERKSKKKYQEIASQLLQLGRVEDYQMLSGLIEDVSEEISKVESMILDISGTNYDMPHISDIQAPLQKEYQKKLRQLFEGEN